MRVLSNSWGNLPFSQALLDEINKADTNAMLFVAAAGNNGSDNDAVPFYPSDYATPNMIAVAATDSGDGLLGISDFGLTTVHLGAPGANIVSTIRNGTYAFYNGTSMAAPHVAGAAALMLAVDGNLTVRQLKTDILSTVDPLPALLGLTVTGGRLNLNGAVPWAVSAPNFTLQASPAAQSVLAGNSTDFTVNVGGYNGFAGPVVLSVSGLPPGAVALWTPAFVAGSGTSTLTVTPSDTNPSASYLLTITAASGTLVHTTTVTLVVSALPPDFTLSASPSSQTVKRKGSASYTVTVESLHGFAGAVDLTVTGLPKNARASFSPASLAGSGTSTLTVTTTGSTPTGTFTLTLQGVSGGLAHTTPVTLTVTK